MTELEDGYPPMTPTEKDMETAREFVEKWVGPSQDWNEAVAEFAAALAAQREKDAGICERREQEAMRMRDQYRSGTNPYHQWDCIAASRRGDAAAIRSLSARE